MNNVPDFKAAAARGFVFDGARKWILDGRANVANLAYDAALVTTANTTIPAELTSYISSEVIRILTAPENATEILSEVKEGDWTTSQMKWRTEELVGETQPYGDYAHTGKSDVNNDWNTQEQYLFQTIIEYGDLETAVSSAARINLAADKQRAAAATIQHDRNKFYLYGVSGKDIYGLLNNPHLMASVVAKPGAGGGSDWDSKTREERYNDILDLLAVLTMRTRGHINEKSRLILAIAPSTSVQLGGVNDYNLQVMDAVKKFFTNLTAVILPELDASSGKSMMLIAPEILGMRTGYFAFSEQMRAGRVVPDLSSFAQKFTAGTYGHIAKIPMAYATLTDI